MIKFTEKEYEYILNKIKEDRKYFDTCTKKELMEWLEDMNGDNYNTVISFTEYEHKLEGINKIKPWNVRVINYISEIHGMWVWLEHEFDRDEVSKYIKDDPIYLDIYEKILNDDEE
ncbi:hypothetical protein [Clostridium botulinum]|uniref:hypothetical protein n=1 Tax=Clostridium botulinum TaxID=1491 RepID=UPI001E2B8518|nr:hypothetical protein [Clostridium botulinum]MCD3254368.1 hypothetical protein [Clostridium botulinum C/D]MCD3279868.1 hypothetical protein [Clostridium botulinum C/D]MCD3339599.1 hypothetical protein [Clostridium botulinum C/D]MCD3357507.1 hypothetical protein [Clostridium botulinum C/D]